MRPVFLLFLALLAVPQAGLTAESDSPSLAGSRVRLSAPPLGPRKLAGTLVEGQGDGVLPGRGSVGMSVRLAIR